MGIYKVALSQEVGQKIRPIVIIKKISRVLEVDDSVQVISVYSFLIIVML